MMKENRTWLASKGSRYLQFLLWTKCSSDVGQYWSLWWWVLGVTQIFLRQSAPDMLHKTLLYQDAVYVLYTVFAFAIKDMTQINSLLLNSAVLDISVWILLQSPSQQNSSFRSLGIYVTSLLLLGLEQPLCWWLWRVFRPGWPDGSEGSHTATTVVSILESVYMLLWRATLWRMARSSSSS